MSRHPKVKIECVFAPAISEVYDIYMLHKYVDDTHKAPTGGDVVVVRIVGQRFIEGLPQSIEGPITLKSQFNDKDPDAIAALAGGERIGWVSKACQCYVRFFAERMKTRPKKRIRFCNDTMLTKVFILNASPDDMFDDFGTPLEP